MAGGQERAIEQYSAKLEGASKQKHHFYFKKVKGIRVQPNYVMARFPVCLLLNHLLHNFLKNRTRTTVVLVGNRAAYLWPLFIFFTRTYLYLHTEIDFDHGFKSLVRKQLLKFAIMGTRKTFSVGDTILKVCANEQKIVTVVPDFLVKKKSKRFDKSESYKFLYCGVITEQKGCIDLISAFTKLPESYQITLIGHLSRNLIGHSFQLPPNIKILPFTDSRELLLRQYEASDFYVSLSRTESFGLSVLTALQYALPIICTNISGHRKILGANYPFLLMNNTKHPEFYKEIIKFKNEVNTQSFKYQMEHLRDTRIAQLEQTLFSDEFMKEIMHGELL